MAKKKPEDPAIQPLVGQLLQALQESRGGDGQPDPPTLRALAAKCAGATSDKLVLNAASNKSFTAKAVVSKVNRKASLESTVSLKEPPKPPPPTIEEIATRMVLVLQSQRLLGRDAYPTPLRRLAELSGVKASDKNVSKAITHATLTEKTAVIDSGTKRTLDSRVALNEDIEGGLEFLFPALLIFALNEASKPGKPTNKLPIPPKIHAFTGKELEKNLQTDLHQPFSSELERRRDKQDLPPEVGWIEIKQPHFFLIENLHPVGLRTAAAADGNRPVPSIIREGPPSALARAKGDLSSAFREAFDRLDRRNGATNFVKLSDLRRALSEFSREEFDAGLRQLRLAEQFSLDSHEGLYGSLTQEDREAGVQEAGTVLIYASRR